MSTDISAIAGGSIAVPKVMGSASTNLKCGIGGWEGRALSAGDYLPFVTKNVDFLDNLGSHALKDDSFYGFSSDEIVLARSAGTARRHVHRTGR